MKAPKILPWIARQTGISDELALNLWRRAAGEAELLSGNSTSSEYYRLAVERLIDLSEEEGEKSRSVSPLTTASLIARLHWMRRYQAQLWQINLLSTQNVCRFWLANWTRAIGHHEQSA